MLCSRVCFHPLSMNILIASARQWSPDEEWRLLGVKNLLQEALGTAIQWMLYDNNPDLLERETKVHRRHLLSNSFHHQSLLPFSAVVIAGGPVWSGPPLEMLFGILSKFEIPLYALGISGPLSHTTLSDLDLLVYSRHSTKVVVQEWKTMEWLRRFDLESMCLPCPSLFAVKESENRRASPGSTIGLIWQGVPSPELRQFCQSVEWLSKHHEISVLCPTSNEFMHLAPMFGNKIKYSYDANDYFEMLSSINIVVTNSKAFAIMANTLEKPAIFLTDGGSPIIDDANQKGLEQYPYIHPTPLQNVGVKIEQVTSEPREELGNWKARVKEGWISILRDEPIFLQKAA